MKKMSAFAFLLSLTACTSVRVFSPNPAVDVPELRGDRGFKINSEIVGAHDTKSTDDASARPPDFTHPSNNTAFDEFTGATYAPLSNLEAGLELSPLHLGVAGVFRFQVLGAGARTAETGNFPLSLYLKAGEGDSQNTGDDVSYYSYKGKISEAYLHGGLSLGYRTSKNMLVYGGAAYGRYWWKSSVDQDYISVSDPGGSYKASGRGEGVTAGGGLFFNWRVVQFFVAGELTHLKYENVDERSDMYLHAGIFITPGGGKSQAPAVGE